MFPPWNLYHGTNGSDVLKSLFSSAVDETFYGFGGDDFIDGRLGADTMYGGTGNDDYVVDNTGDQVVENANEGIDKVYSSISYPLGADVEDLELTGTAAINGTGNSLETFASR
jgi:Ca2+-binding RTX toxin-like protein